MLAYKVVTTVESDHVVTLREVPFHEGERVEVIVLAGGNGRGAVTYPLRGRPVQYEEPTKPVAPTDWDAQRDNP